LSVYYHIINDQDQFYNLQEEWNTLLLESELESPFLTWEWMYSWWEFYGKENAERELAIVVAREGNYLKAILPGYIKKKSVWGQKLKVYYFLGTEYESSDYLEIITKDVNDDQYSTDIFNFLLSPIKIDIFSIFNLLEHSLFLKKIKSYAEEKRLAFIVKHNQRHPYIDINEDFENYTKKLSRKMNKNLRW